MSSYDEDLFATALLEDEEDADTDDLDGDLDDDGFDPDDMDGFDDEDVPDYEDLDDHDE